MEEEIVLLVDSHDNVIGEAPKMQAHRDGSLHRAISVFLFDEEGRILLQRRAAGKYHSAGLWSNASCTHPRPGEAPADAARRRLREEMGMEADLEFRGTFVYRAELDSSLIEHELDHLFTGRASSEPQPAPEEVSEWRWVHPEELATELAATPERFTAWFPIAYDYLLVAADDQVASGTINESGDDG